MAAPANRVSTAPSQLQRILGNQIVRKKTILTVFDYVLAREKLWDSIASFICFGIVPNLIKIPPCYSTTIKDAYGSPFDFIEGQKQIIKASVVWDRVTAKNALYMSGITENRIYEKFFYFVGVVGLVDVISSLIVFRSALKNQNESVNRLTSDIIFSKSELALRKIKLMQYEFDRVHHYAVNVFMAIAEYVVVRASYSCLCFTKSANQDRGLNRFGDFTYLDPVVDHAWKPAHVLSVVMIVMSIAICVLQMCRFYNSFKVAKKEFPELSTRERQLLTANFRPRFLLNQIAK